MKYIKQSILAVLAVFISISLCGCAALDTLGTVIGINAVEEAEAVPKIAFGTEVLSDDSNEIIMTADEVSQLRTELSVFRGDMHYNTLSEDEKTVYRAYEYALENGYIYIYVDDLIVSEYERLSEILTLFALDSPILEQNLLYEHGDFTLYYDVNTMFFDGYAALDGYYIQVDNFNAEILAKKQQAIEKAKEIIASLPSGMTDIEKADYLHKYTLSNVEYYDYTEFSADNVYPYLYDGLVGGRTHCDGSANMYSLLLSIAGIECVEKQYTGEDADIGHTWNFAKLGDSWYNIDATASEESSESDFDIRQKRNFAFEDRLQPYIPDFSEVYPSASSGIGMSIDAHTEKISVSDFVKTVKKSFAENGSSQVLILVDDYSDSSADRAIQKLADSLKTTVYWITYEVVDDRTAVIVFK